MTTKPKPKQYRCNHQWINIGRFTTHKDCDKCKEVEEFNNRLLEKTKAIKWWQVWKGDPMLDYCFDYKFCGGRSFTKLKCAKCEEEKRLYD